MKTQKFIEQSKKTHGEKYVYSKVKYTKNHDKVCIICPEHGEFWQSAKAHKEGQGCKKCSEIIKSNKRKLPVKIFIQRATEIHKGKYDYSKVEYERTDNKICIICPIHGEFWQIGSAHLNTGVGCLQCYNDNRSEKYTWTHEKFAKVSHDTWGKKFKILSQYTGMHNKIEIFCPKHGKQNISPISHLYGKSGCPKCSIDGGAEQRKYTTEDFISKATEVHNGKYDYSKSTYTVSSEYVKIICPEHGGFKQRPYSHLQGFGCPSCSYLVSKPEIEVQNFMSSLGVKTIKNSRPLKRDGKRGNLEIDILAPSHNFGIEFNGIYWHSELQGKCKKYHLWKTDQAKQQLGMNLIHIWDSEWHQKKDIVKSILSNKLGKIENRIYARKCKIKEVSITEKNQFLDNNHLQGKDKSSIKLGLYYENNLVSIMTFGTRRITGKTSFEMIRFCNLINTTVIGAASKLFKYFLNNYWSGQEITTYADKRYSNGELYNILGFQHSHDSPPNYWYTKDHLALEHRSNFMKHKLAHKLETFDPSLTEWGNMQKNNYDRIWDCGNMVFKYNK